MIGVEPIAPHPAAAVATVVITYHIIREDMGISYGGRGEGGEGCERYKIEPKVLNTGFRIYHTIRRSVLSFLVSKEKNKNDQPSAMHSLRVDIYTRYIVFSYRYVWGAYGTAAAVLHVLGVACMYAGTFRPLVSFLLLACCGQNRVEAN